MLFKKGIKKNGIKVIGFRKSVNKIALIKPAEKESVKFKRILLKKISNILIGLDFKIHKFLPSKDIDELVVIVIDSNTLNRMTIKILWYYIISKYENQLFKYYEEIYFVCSAYVFGTWRICSGEQ